MELQTEKSPSVEIFEDETVDIGNQSRVVLFNDDWHTFEEVISQIIKATGCSFDDARERTFEVHNNGKSVVYNGEMNSCLKVSSVLEEIALHTQVET
jgi:ATP-dependent Clp protease adaptor protein ClpS